MLSVITRLQRLEEEFYSVINVPELATSLEIDQGIIDLIYVYWKLKRKVSICCTGFIMSPENLRSLHGAVVISLAL